MGPFNRSTPLPPWRRRTSAVLLLTGLGYFLFCLSLFLWLGPRETMIAGFKLSLVTLTVPLKLSLGLVLSGLYLRYFDSPRVDPLLVLCGLGAAFFLLPHQLGGDGEVRFVVLRRILEGGPVSAMSYSLVGPLFSSPLYWLGKAALTPEWWCARYNVVLLALGFFLIYRLVGSQWGPTRLYSFFLLVLAASMFPNHLRFYSGEVFTAVGVAVGTLALMSGRPRLGWTAVSLGVLNTPAAIPALALISLQRCFTEKSLKNLIPLLVTLALFLLENALRKGGFFLTGYENNAGFTTLLPYSGLPGFSYPLILGIFSILFSSGKGLLFFAPGMFLPLKKWKDRTGETYDQTCRLWLLFVAGLILVYAQWWSWYGGFFWGPRLFLFASLPAALVLAARLDLSDTSLGKNLVTFSVLTLSFWVGLNGAVFDQQGLDICLENQQALEFLCWYVPEFSVLWRPMLVPWRLDLQQEALVAYSFLVWLHLSRPLLNRLLKQGWQGLTDLRRHLSQDRT